MRCCAFILLLHVVVAAAGELDTWVEAADDPAAVQEWLDDLRADPLNVNTATAAELAALPFFDRGTARAIIAERSRGGAFLSLIDLARRTSLTEHRRIVLEEFTFAGPLAVTAPLRSMFRTVGGRRSTSAANSGRDWWSSARADFTQSGGPRGYLYGKRRSGDLELLSAAAAGIEWPQLGSRPRVAVGSFQLEAGTGLVFGSAWGMGAWLSAPFSAAPKTARGLTVRPAADRMSTLQGAALSRTAGGVTAMLLFSHMQLDAALANGGGEQITEGEAAAPELARARENQIAERLWGATCEAGRGGLRAGATFSRAAYTPPLREAHPDDPEHRFSGKTLENGSAYLRLRSGPVSAVSEAALSAPGGTAHQTAVTAANETAALTVFHSAADADYFALRSRLWGGRGIEARNRRTTGIRMAAALPGHRLSLTGSTSRTPFRTASSPLTHGAADMESRWAWNPAADTEVELLVGRRWREVASETAPAIERSVDRGRIDVIWRAVAEYRLRFEARSAARAEQRDRKLGTLLFVQAKTRTPWLDAFFRVTAFNIEHSDAAMDVYEHAPAGAYPLVAINGAGLRAAAMLTRRWNAVTGALKIARTQKTVAAATYRDWEISVQMSSVLI